MNKIYSYVGVFFIIFFMVSTVTAIPKINSDPLMDRIYKIEQKQLNLSEKISEIYINLEKGGLIDLLTKIIQWLIDLVEETINLVLEIFNLVEIIGYLIDLISSLLNAIMELIDRIFEIFNP